MNIQLEVNNQTKSPIEDSFFYVVAQKVLDQPEFAFLSEKTITLSLAIVSEDEMRSLNKKYRGKDCVTDVLSFSEYDQIDEIRKNDEPSLFLGEIILCYNDIEKYCAQRNISLPVELQKVTAHGILHLLGFEHGEAMFAIQDNAVFLPANECLNKAKIKFQNGKT